MDSEFFENAMDDRDGLMAPAAAPRGARAQERKWLTPAQRGTVRRCCWGCCTAALLLHSCLVARLHTSCLD
eukprot:COSAG03_NODE_19381_length_337_cov_404.033613_1_plen_70_part_01